MFVAIVWIGRDYRECVWAFTVKINGKFGPRKCVTAAVTAVFLNGFLYVDYILII